jgi:hypothetical protein
LWSVEADVATRTATTSAGVAVCLAGGTSAPAGMNDAIHSDTRDRYQLDCATTLASRAAASLLTAVAASRATAATADLDWSWGGLSAIATLAHRIVHVSVAPSTAGRSEGSTAATGRATVAILTGSGLPRCARCCIGPSTASR